MTRRRREPGAGRRGPREHRRPTAVDGASGRRAGRRHHPARRGIGDRFEPAGEQLLKGNPRPVPASRAAVRAKAGRQGRHRARSALRRARRRAAAPEGAVPRDRARASSATGLDLRPAGIGKSRLAWEFLAYLDGLVGRRLVARRPQPSVRRRRCLLGPRRDGSLAGGPRSKATTSRRPGRASAEMLERHVADEDERAPDRAGAAGAARASSAG